MATAGQVGFNESEWGGFLSGVRPIARYKVHLAASAGSLNGIVQGDLIEITALWNDAPIEIAMDSAKLTISREDTTQSITITEEETQYGILVSSGQDDGIAEARFYLPTDGLAASTVWDAVIEFIHMESSASWRTKLGLV